MSRAPGDSAAWRTVGMWLHQDVDVMYDDPLDAFSAAAASLSPAERSEVAAMLRRALSTSTDAEPLGVWRRAPSDVEWDKRSVRAAMSAALDAMQADRHRWNQCARPEPPE